MQRTIMIFPQFDNIDVINSIRNKYDLCYVVVYWELFHKYGSHKDVYCVRFEAVRSEAGLTLEYI